MFWCVNRSLRFAANPRQRVLTMHVSHGLARGRQQAAAPPPHHVSEWKGTLGPDGREVQILSAEVMSTQGVRVSMRWCKDVISNTHQVWHHHVCARVRRCATSCVPDPPVFLVTEIHLNLYIHKVGCHTWLPWWSVASESKLLINFSLRGLLWPQ